MAFDPQRRASERLLESIDRFCRAALGDQRRNEAGDYFRVAVGQADGTDKLFNSRKARLEQRPGEAVSDQRLARGKLHGASKSGNRKLPLLLLAMDEAFDVPQPGIVGRNLQRAIDVAQRERPTGYLQGRDRIIENLGRIDGRQSRHHRLSTKFALLAPITAATARRSPGASAGGHRSMRSTTRSSSLSFHASCALLSSKTNA